jgi:hypothetical protein
MDTPELYRHRHTGTLYWLIGHVPGTKNLVVVPKSETIKSYTIGTDELSQYYELVPEDTFEVHRTYKSISTGATFLVESLHVHPTDDVTVAFGWYQRDGSREIHPQVFYLSDRENWEPHEATS